MSPQFDIRWLSLSVDGNDGLDEAVAAEKRPQETVSDDGRFEALLNSHLRWATSASVGGMKAASGVPGQATDAVDEAVAVPGNPFRSTRIAKEVSEQLARIAQVGVAA